MVNRQKYIPIKEIDKVVIVGGGQAGGQFVKTVRSEGFSGEVVLIGDEGHRPYERPPLSKSGLSSDADASAAVSYLFDAEALRKLDVKQEQRRVAAIDRVSRTVTCQDGWSTGYDGLVLATGGRAVTLAVSDPLAAAVRTLRTIEDARALRERFDASQAITVIGGGWLGLEVASAARRRGLQVVLIESGMRLCGRVVPPMLSGYLARLHQQQGVQLRLGVGVVAISGEPGRIALTLSNGEKLEAHTIFVGVGMVPNDELAGAAGLEVDRGIVTDASGRTSDPRVFACGDVATFHHPLIGRRVRLESWANAQNQATACARAFLGLEPSPVELPWFWSNQYDNSIQIAGLPPLDASIVVRGDPQSSSFSFFSFVDERLAGAVAVNADRDVRIAKRLIEAGIPVDAMLLRDPSINLQKLLVRS